MLGPSEAPPVVNRLAKLRVDAGLSLSAAAEGLEIEEGSLSDIECGAAESSTPLLANIARLYHVNPHVLVKAYLADRRASRSRLLPRG